MANTLNWGYTGKNGQDKWGSNIMYLGCKEGNQQSPINITTKAVRQGASSFDVKYMQAKGINLSLENYSFQITYPPKSFLSMNGVDYELQYIRLKTPAENMINSLQAMMEAQFFHKDSKGNMLIMSVLFMEGRANSVIDMLIKNLPKQKGKANFIANVDVYKLLPNTFDSYQFDGSLTTPPCTQGVRWIVLKQPISMTKSQVDALHNITKSNARHTQDVANRLIVE